MATKTLTLEPLATFYKVRKGRIEFVDLPELGFVMIDGSGAPGGTEFADARAALYSVSYGAHFAVKKTTGEAPRVMPLEALWWADGEEAQAVMERLAAGEASIDESDRTRWRWRAMIMQLPTIDGAVIERAVADARARKPVPSLDRLRFERWAEGPSAQILHIGPYATEASSVVALHRAIAGHSPCDRAGVPVAGGERAHRGGRVRDLVHRPLPKDDLRVQQRSVPLDVAGRAPRPVLLIAGEPERRGDRQLRAAAPGSVELWELPDTPHIAGLARHPAEWEARVIGFLDRALPPPTQ